MNLEQRVREYIATMAAITTPVVPAVIANDLLAIVEASSTSDLAAPPAADLATAIGSELDRAVGATFRGARTDHAFRAWAQSDGQAVAWEFRDNSWRDGMWASITREQYENYLSPDITGPRDSWQVRALFDHPYVRRAR
jgi:hypothetical protein